jgi:hypothetical protein
MELRNGVLDADANAKQCQSSRRTAGAMADAKQGDEIKLTTMGRIEVCESDQGEL